MSNRVTPLHRALGVVEGGLADLLPIAVAQKVAESEDLDWKRELPHPSKPTAMLELSTDLAAMANTSGGLIVYGVEEAEGQELVNAAGQLVPIPGSGSEIDQRLLQAAYQAQPPIRSVLVEPVVVASGEHLYAVHVEASEEAPHLVMDRSRPDWFRAPIRHGAHTQYMTERQLEAAYNTRFRVAARAESNLAELADQIHGHFASSDYPVLVAVAVPRRPRPAWADSLSLDEARYLFAVAHRLTSPPFPHLQYGQLPDGHRVRVGMRRWVGRYDQARSEIHHDGSIACAIELGPWRASSDQNAAPNEVASSMVERLACEFAALAHDAGVKLGIDTYDVRVHIAWDEEGPLFVRLPHPILGSFYDEAEPENSVRVFQPVLTSLTPSPSEAAWLSDAAVFARDLLAQVGLEPTKL